MKHDLVLEKLGLTPNEVKIYTYLLNTQVEQSAAEVILALSMDKVSTYRSLKSLQQQRLVISVGETRNQQFKVAPSKELFAKYNAQVQDMTALRDQLEDLVQSATNRQHEFYQNNRITVYKGIEGYKQWNERRLDEARGVIYEFSSGAIIEGMFKNPKIQREYLEGYIKRRVKKKIAIRSLMSDRIQRESYDRTDPALYKEQRIIHPAEDLDGFITIFGDCFGFYTRQAEEYIGVVISDPIIAKMMLVTYGLLWGQGVQV